MGASTKERPIPFNDAMVRAILDGRKTMTRRVVRPEPSDWTASHYANSKIITHDLEDYETGVRYGFGFEDEERSWNCPYGKPGDRLWVKETWAKVPQTAYWHDQTIPHKELVEEGGYGWWAVYRASWERCAPSWKSPRFMPRWASRILLEIVSIRVERLQDISEAGAIKEGIPPLYHREIDCGSTPRTELFRDLWESIKGKGSWDANPWVWVIEFKMVPS